ncbi:MAG: ATP-binding protein, partial [Ktedonobacteraceae bacterium]
HGIGIPQDQQALIFERFYRVYGDRDTKYPGLGIGLYIAFEIVQRHGGQIWVESVEGRGSTFFFSIPLDRKAPDTETPTHVQQEGIAAS